MKNFMDFFRDLKSVQEQMKALNISTEDLIEDSVSELTAIKGSDIESITFECSKEYSGIGIVSGPERSTCTIKKVTDQYGYSEIPNVELLLIVLGIMKAGYTPANKLLQMWDCYLPEVRTNRPSMVDGRYTCRIRTVRGTLEFTGSLWYK